VARPAPAVPCSLAVSPAGPHAETQADQPALVRALGRWTLAGLVLNVMLGGSIFGLPGNIAALLGSLSPIAYFLAGLGIAVIVMCFAEVASYFRTSGGQYLYVREAFGRFPGIWMAWLFLLVRITAAAANANLFSDYLSRLWSPAAERPLHIAVLTLLIGGLAVVNVRGVTAGAGLSNVFAVAKLLPLTLFVMAGGWYLATHTSLVHPAAAPSLDQWTEALLLLVYAYGGFEAALVPMAEAKDPERDAPFALLVGLAACIAIYAAVQWVVIYTLPDAAGHKTPLAAAAAIILGPVGAMAITLGALISIYGYMSSNILNAPRMIFALAEQKDLPSPLGHVHPVFRTPWVAILVFASVVWLFALAGDFRWNAIISGVTRLLGYAAVCGSVFVFRRRPGMHPARRIPSAPLCALLGIAMCLALTLRMGLTELLLMLATAGLAAGTWVWAVCRKSQ
jgi:APA family basic amino acid/polyamine antiporter